MIIIKHSVLGFRLIGYDLPLVMAIALPPGISFFTFQAIGLLWDNFRVRPAGVLRDAFPGALSCFVFLGFFPQLIAGPIVRGRQFFPRLLGLLNSRADYTGGAFFLVSGYFKKVVLADRLAMLVDPLFGNPEVLAAASPLAVWVAVLAYALQIYFDFSGYSDIAIGLGRLLGFRLPRNFSFPYAAVGWRDFWSRWHITLSRWLRDYVYIPLGGSRRGALGLWLAVMVTMLLGGLWHGAHENFLIWGAAHGLLVLADRRIPEGFRTGIARFFLRGLTFLAVVLLWVWFRSGMESDGFGLALSVFAKLFFYNMGDFELAFGAGRGLPAGWQLVAASFGLLWLAGQLYIPLRRFLHRAPGYLVGGILGVAALGILLWGAVGSRGFIYFVF